MLKPGRPTVSTRCDTGACVQVTALAAVVSVRDTKDPEGPALTVGHDAWRAFLRRIG